METMMASFNGNEARETALKDAIEEGIDVIFSGDGTGFVLGSPEQSYPSHIIIFMSNSAVAMLTMMRLGSSTCIKI